MSTQSRYVATTNDEDAEQTFVFEGTMTLDDVFAHVAQRVRSGSLAKVAKGLAGDYKVFRLSISRDEFAEPTKQEGFEKFIGGFDVAASTGT